MTILDDEYDQASPDTEIEILLVYGTNKLIKDTLYTLKKFHVGYATLVLHF